MLSPPAKHCKSVVCLPASVSKCAAWQCKFNGRQCCFSIRLRLRLRQVGREQRAGQSWAHWRGLTDCRPDCRLARLAGEGIHWTSDQLHRQTGQYTYIYNTLYTLQCNVYTTLYTCFVSHWYIS